MRPRWLLRLAASPWTVPACIAGVIVAIGITVFAVVHYDNTQEQERRNRELAACRDVNELRADIVEKGEATESLIRQILVIVLRPGEGSAERQLAVRDIYNQIRPEFERFNAVLDSVGTPRDCRK